MQDIKPLNITGQQFEEFKRTHRESEYVLLDVRQPAEYAERHIPGAVLLPLPELEPRLLDLPQDKDLVFYCRTGARSMTAASLTAEAEATGKGIYNLLGGITGWDGRTLSDFPRIQVFDTSRDYAELLATAMDLEKGAWRFYVLAAERYGETPAGTTMERLSQAETAHAKMVYGFWKHALADPPAFDTVWGDLNGDILEGGQTVEAMVKRLDALEGQVCLNLIDLALLIEHSAFDLYRTMAEIASDSSAKSAFLSIAQAEKGHMRMLTRALARCI